MKPDSFVDMVFHGVSESGYFSLNQSAIKFQEQHHYTISKQGIDSKFNEEAVEFLKLLFEECFITQISEIIDINFFSSFEQLRIKDGTRFDLPKELRNYFCGFGGRCTSESALCIQYEFDLKSLKFISFKLTDANVLDIAEARKSVGEVSKNELILCDLGYFLLESFTEINNRGAFFVSRLLRGVNVTEKGKRICFKNLYQYMLKTKQSIIEKSVELGFEKAVTVRMIAQLTPDSVYQKRIADLEKSAKKRGYTISEETRCRCRFFLIITNIKAEVVSGEEIFKL